jgi:hypothetical protein
MLGPDSRSENFISQYRKITGHKDRDFTEANKVNEVYLETNLKIRIAVLPFVSFCKKPSALCPL